MLYVVRNDASVIEIDEAVAGQVRDALLVCLDADGKAVRVYPRSDVMAYGTNALLKAAAEAIKERQLA